MSIDLYEHNQTAYKNAISMLNDCNKAAIVHPTGTGKSFIGFKLCEDNPDKRICWLSPSEYIFKTQLENVKKVDPSFSRKNIVFITYAKLMLMLENEIKDISPDYIILDEFHRCGATEWGKGVERLLDMYADVPILGLSATAIRYLDNQRNMADELFDGNIASEMTLGEAVVRGILLPPKYVATVYSFQKDIEKYSAYIKKVKNKTRAEKAEKKLEKLKRMLENADGIDVIINKHITDKTGKYIVFCSNKEHMDEMISHVDEWFCGVNNNIRVYEAYSNNPETSKAFSDFKSDVSDNLKLLFCIDMINEGIHIDDISGVVLLRPTVSPTVFKQQIGRAMAVGSKKNAVILDIVDNISNLYSIDSIRDEMQNAIDFYNYHGEQDKIVADTFTVIDEVYDCRKLFDELEDMLSASWDIMYLEAKKYYEANGHLLPEADYVTELGYPIGQWMVTQRQIYRKGTLSKEKIQKLEKIGMSWLTRNERFWNEKYELAKQFYLANGHLRPTDKDRNLKSWILRQRKRYHDNELSNEEYEKLSEIGMVWDIESSWDVNFPEATKFYEKYGHLDIPVSYVTETGIKLGIWYRSIRGQYRDGILSPEKKKQLENIGIEWTSVKIRTWMKYYELAKEYYETHGDLAVHAKYTTENGLNLGVWISSQRYAMKKGTLSQEQISLLDKIGMSWHQFKNKWDLGYDYALQYYEEYGNIDVPLEYENFDGFRLGAWIASQRSKYRNSKLKPNQIKRLEDLHIKWNPTKDSWRDAFSYAEDYYKKHGDLLVSAKYISPNGFRLGAWLSSQRVKRKKGLLTDEQVRLLDSYNMCWDVNEKKWLDGYAEAKQYFLEHGNLNIPNNYITETGFRLHEWIGTNKMAYKKGNLSNEKVSMLEEINICWNKIADNWLTTYEIAKEYQKKFNNLSEISADFKFKNCNLGEWIRTQHRSWRNGKLKVERQQMLAEIGIVFEKELIDAAV